MANIVAVNADGAAELALIATALKSARARYLENELNPRIDLIDDALAVVDRLFAETGAPPLAGIE